MVFTCSMGDLFHHSVPNKWICDVINEVYTCQNHTFLFLTKRPERMRYFFRDYNADDWSNFPNLWLGVTAENQKRADERIPILLQIPAAVRFVSVEPMLERMYISKYLYNQLDWVICGAETGPGARYMQPQWAYHLYDQCKRAETPFFFKKASKGTIIDLPREYPK